MSSCKCQGCETQRYYDGVRKEQISCKCSKESKTYTLSISATGSNTKENFYKEIDLYDFYNIVSEHFGVEVDLGCCGE